MTIQGLAAGAPQGGWNLADALTSFEERLSARRAARRRYRTVRAELLGYSPQQLAELGISEADIGFVAESASRLRTKLKSCDQR